MQLTPHPRTTWAAPIAVFALLAASATAQAKDRLDIRLSGYSEAPSSLSTPASGRFKGQIDEKAGTISYELSYSGIVSEVRQAHIHIGRRALNGGIMVWLCGSATNPGPPGLQVCPPQSGRFEGVIQAADVLAVTPQGVTAGSFQALVDAIRADAAYVNVHSADFPGGEIRGQLRDD